MGDPKRSLKGWETKKDGEPKRVESLKGWGERGSPNGAGGPKRTLKGWGDPKRSLKGGGGEQGGPHGAGGKRSLK